MVLVGFVTMRMVELLRRTAARRNKREDREERERRLGIYHYAIRFRLKGKIHR